MTFSFNTSLMTFEKYEYDTTQRNNFEVKTKIDSNEQK